MPDFEGRVAAVFKAPPGEERSSKLVKLFTLKELMLMERCLERQRRLTRKDKMLLALIQREDLPGIIRMARLRASAAKVLRQAGRPFSGQVFRRVTGRELPVAE
jgi:hypothetical protein